MFVNSSLGEIFLVNSATRTIHAASRLTERCGITGENNYCFPDLAKKDGSGRVAMPEAGKAAMPEEALSEGDRPQQASAKLGE